MCIGWVSKFMIRKGEKTSSNTRTTIQRVMSATNLPSNQQAATNDWHQSSQQSTGRGRGERQKIAKSDDVPTKERRVAKSQQAAGSTQQAAANDLTIGVVQYHRELCETVAASVVHAVV